MRALRIGALGVLVLACGATAARALPIALVTVERSARAEASASAGGASDFDEVDLSDPEPGSIEWRSDAAIASAGQGAGVEAYPFLLGYAATDGLYADASAEVGVFADAAGAFAFGSAEVVQRIVFVATADAVLHVVGEVTAISDLGASTGDSFALLEITSLGGPLDPDPLRIRRTAEPEQSVTLDLDFEIRSGESYQILSLARAQADALDSGAVIFHSNVTLDFSAVPEPGTATLLAAGLAWLVRRARR